MNKMRSSLKKSKSIKYAISYCLIYRVYKLLCLFLEDGFDCHICYLGIKYLGNFWKATHLWIKYGTYIIIYECEFLKNKFLLGWNCIQI